MFCNLQTCLVLIVYLFLEHASLRCDYILTCVCVCVCFVNDKTSALLIILYCTISFDIVILVRFIYYNVRFDPFHATNQYDSVIDLFFKQNS